ncbi:C-type mannose receptor 2 [Amphibalanus amphitrite]|uniref:C-type mannose receptor 2 n=1 Tax=Amphibalanus amphitrite TaxID=1232801 RepID=A0A6A4W2S2_AMPAM|nr:macrophage mannose receptor 1-like [Amphibalanus amphitrite]KAF0298064.1 C-type mannose receptor 2 [Amphibalanus amphitrite]
MSDMIKHEDTAAIVKRSPGYNVLVWFMVLTSAAHQVGHVSSGSAVAHPGPGSGPLHNSTALWAVHSVSAIAPVRCLPGWRRHRRSCYRALTVTPVRYDEARERCHQLDPAADLPITRDLGEVEFVQGLAAPPERPTAVFLGATDRQTEGQLLWHDGSPVALDNSVWASHEPTNSSRQNCLLLMTQLDRAAGRAVFSAGDTSCSTATSTVVCQMPFSVLALPVRTPENETDEMASLKKNRTGCDHYGSVRFGGSCYLYQDDYLTQPEAERLCRRRGFRLASVESQTENDFIRKLILDVAWLGGQLRGRRWRWSDGRPLLFTRWAAASAFFHQQPDGRSRERCLNMLSSVRSGWVGDKQLAGDGYWADNECAVRWPSVCEIPATA